MVTPTCPKCRRTIPSDDVNVANDVAYCRFCNLAHSLAALTHGAELDAYEDLSQPPAGAWQRSDGIWRIIGATHRSLGMALGALAVAVFWNGIVSVFVLLALAATLRHLGIETPEWFPAPKMDGDPLSVGMTIFLWLFLTPFILIGGAMIGAFLSGLGGRTEVRVRSSEGVVFTGIGPLGWRRRFTPSAVKEVRLNDESWRDSDGDRRNKTHIVIELDGRKPIKFGSALTAERRKFVAAALRRALRN